ncbi:MAG: helix-turn-helix transcriptional regulator [Nitrosomonadales bacterium]|nr:helix-turn-helix transcriptional regulator [Nitrosomonadales bacterium]
MELGKIVKKLREKKGLSQDELAFRTNTSAANISRIENAKHGAGQELLEALAKEFGYKLYELIALAENIDTPAIPADLDAGESEMLADYRNMNNTQREILRQISKQFVSSLKSDDKN